MTRMAITSMVLLTLMLIVGCRGVGEGHRPQEGGPGGGYYGYTTTTTTLKPGAPNIP